MEPKPKNERISEAIRRRWADPAFKQRYSERHAERMKDPEYAAARQAQCAAAGRRSWDDPETRAQRAAQTGQLLRAMWQDPTHRPRLLANLRNRVLTPEARALRSAKTQASWTDPVYREAITTKVSTSMLAQWAGRSDEEREQVAKRMGSGQAASWADPVKGPLRRARFLASYDKKPSTLPYLEPGKWEAMSRDERVEWQLGITNQSKETE